MIQTIAVKHNVEMAHRLFQTPGKCENIHGHSWNIELALGGEVDGHGLLEGLDFGLVKSTFRKYLDDEYDHRVLLNRADPWADTLYAGAFGGAHEERLRLPGLQIMPFHQDPTTENFAATIGKWAQHCFPMCPLISVHVWETRVNCASWSSVNGS